MRPPPRQLAIACRHCGECVMTVPTVTEAALVRLTAHLFARHPECEEHPRWQGLHDVLWHFSTREV